MENEAVRDVSTEEFVKLLESEKIVFVDFHATWCSPCKAMAPVVDRLSQEYSGRVAFVKVDVDDNPGLAAQFGVKGVPTFLVLEDGKPVSRIIGATSQSELAGLLEGRVGAAGQANNDGGPVAGLNVVI